jgi:hypothetical protein
VAHMDGALDDVKTVIDRECTNGRQSVQPHVRTQEPDDGISAR